MELIDEQNLGNFPVVLAGDFNSNGGLNAVGEPPDSAFSDEVMPRALSAGYVDTFTVSGVEDDEAGITFHAYEGADVRSERHGGAGRLDWILARGLTPTGYQRITHAAPPAYPSDHWPILATLDLAG
jgi:endonuclease/exonuclease/phosphatase family metal-dependent hydrolase